MNTSSYFSMKSKVRESDLVYANLSLLIKSSMFAKWNDMKTKRPAILFSLHSSIHWWHFLANLLYLYWKGGGQVLYKYFEYIYLFSNLCLAKANIFLSLSECLKEEFWICRYGEGRHKSVSIKRDFYFNHSLSSRTNITSKYWTPFYMLLWTRHLL